MTDSAKCYTAAEVRDLAIAACLAAGGQSAWARKLGVSRQYVHQVVSGECAPNCTMLKALGISTAGITPHDSRTPRKYQLDKSAKDA
jgi:DNA-binding transcriptional regulator YdaS (Cro superfamily)